MGKKRRAVRCRKEGDSRDVEQSLCELRGRWSLHSDQVFTMTTRSQILVQGTGWKGSNCSLQWISCDWELLHCISISNSLGRKKRGGNMLCVAQLVAINISAIKVISFFVYNWGFYKEGMVLAQLFADRKRYTSHSWVKYCNLRAKINPNRAAEACRHHLLLSWVAVSM